MPIILRLIKGSELTFAELDGNFQDLDSRTDALELLNIGPRLTFLENNIQTDAFDSAQVMSMLDSVFAGNTDTFLASTDSIGLASFDSDHFNVNSGHVTIKLAGYTPSDSAGIASFDSSEFVVTDGHVTINPNSAPGRYASYTPVDSTGVASFDSANFVVTDGHVTINPNSTAGRVAGYTEIDSTGVASFDSSDFTVNANGHVTLNIASTTETGVASFNSSDFSVSGTGEVTLAGGGNIPVASFNSIGSFAFVQCYNVPNGTKYAVGANIPGNRIAYGSGTSATAGKMSFQMFQAGSYGYFLGSSGAIYSNTLSGTWRNLGPGWVGYSSASPYLGNPQANGSSHFLLVQRVA